MNYLNNPIEAPQSSAGSIFVQWAIGITSDINSKSEHSMYTLPGYPLKTIILSAPEEEQYKRQASDRLKSMFAQHKAIELKSSIPEIADASTEKEVAKTIENSDLILLLVSEQYLKSALHNNTVIRKALQNRKNGISNVVPILVRDCNWEQDSFLNEIEVLTYYLFWEERGEAIYHSPDSEHAEERWDVLLMNKLSPLLNDIRKQKLAQYPADERLRLVIKLEEQSAVVKAAKEQAIKKGNYEEAANLRDWEVKLLTDLEFLRIVNH